MPRTNRGWEPREYLNSLILHGVKLGLNNINALMAVCENPHRACPVVHVAGTNGKGSTLAFLAAILEAAGYRTGRFTSPHLLDVTERFLIGNHPMPEAALRENVSFFKELSETLGVTPTFFEMNTAIAFRWFAQQAVDVALIEVGMGGRFDSTNIVSPEVCAITNIDLDHTRYLGETPAAIAFEKAGILKQGVPAVIGEMGDEALSVIREQAALKNAPLHGSGSAYVFKPGGTVWRPLMVYRGFGRVLNDLELGLAGMHQAHNAALAVSLALLLKGKFSRVTDGEIRAGVSSARWPGRLERVMDTPPVYMDAAHNPAGCRVLSRALKRCAIIFSVSADKDAKTMIDTLAPLADPLILTTYQDGRSLSLDLLRQQAGSHPVLSFSHMADALEAGMHIASAETPLLITGSIYGAGEARRILMEQYGARPPTFDVSKK